MNKRVLLFLFLLTIGMILLYPTLVKYTPEAFIVGFQQSETIKTSTFHWNIKISNSSPIHLTDTTLNTATTNRTLTATSAPVSTKTVEKTVSDATYALSNPTSQSPTTDSVPNVSFDVVHNLSNIVINRGPGRTVHHIYSAYYDSRPLSYRPSIVMLGYVYKRTHDNIQCKFIYEDGSTECVGNLFHAALIAPNVMPEMYFCRVNSQVKIPTHVILSPSGWCKGNWTSPIPVWNRESGGEDGVGMCVHGAMYTGVSSTRQETLVHQMVEFLAMVKVLGVKIVTMYNLNVRLELVERVLKFYPEFVDMVQWKNLTGILHYHGQRLLLNDCLYRNMKRVKYLAFFDLDEMIFPVSTDNWMDMLKILNGKGKYASYTFSNNFFAEIPLNESKNLANYSCPYMKLPKYFVRRQRLPWPGFKQNTKMKVIVKPEAISAQCIHEVCRSTVSGYGTTFRVPQSIGLMAHYRVPVQKEYIYGKGVEDRTALKYKDQVMQEITRVCSLIDT